MTHDSFYLVVVLKSLLRGQSLAKHPPVTDNEGLEGAIVIVNRHYTRARGDFRFSDTWTGVNKVLWRLD